MPGVLDFQQLSEQMDLRKQARAEKYYHSAKKLVEIYSSVMWGLETSHGEAQAACVGMGYEDIREALDFLEAGFSDGQQGLRLDDTVRSMLFTNGLIKLVDKAMWSLQAYPNCGERYFDIINRMYLIKYAYSEDDMMGALNVSRSTFYREKKRALSLLGVILWGYMLPSILHSIRDMRMTPE
jgi:hypothetical protein